MVSAYGISIDTKACVIVHRYIDRGLILSIVAIKQKKEREKWYNRKTASILKQDPQHKMFLKKVVIATLLPHFWGKPFFQETTVKR